MKVELTYRYSELDKEPQFGLVLAEGKEDHHYRWVWYYLGVRFGRKRVTLYPFALCESSFSGGKKVGQWGYHSADRLAGYIYKRILKYL